jgi:biotin carboxylase
MSPRGSPAQGTVYRLSTPGHAQRRRLSGGPHPRAGLPSGTAHSQLQRHGFLCILRRDDSRAAAGMRRPNSTREAAMPEQKPLTILCLASDVKGHEFMRECHRLGCRVLLLTRQVHADGDWPRDAIADTFYMPSLLQREDLVKGVSWLARTQSLDRIVALDDFDVEQAALLREHLRVPGMGDTTARYFRDKLAMRVRAEEAGIRVPEFVHALNDDAVRSYAMRVPPPWVLKPRSEGSAAGIKKVASAEELGRRLDELGDLRSFYVVEKYIAGDVYHVDAVVSERELPFAVASRYGKPPLDVMHSGDLFVTRTLPDDAPDARQVIALTQELLTAVSFLRGVTHTEFIQGPDGVFYFLETAARVGGAHIAEVVEAATGINLWREWARVEVGGGKVPYEPPTRHHRHAGIVLSLARQEWPDTSAYTDPEIVWRLNLRHHVGLIIASDDSARIDQLIENYSRRFHQDFFASGPGLERVER